MESGTVIATTERTRHPRKTSVSARDQYRSASMVIPASSGQDVAVFLRIVQDPADPAYHAGHRIFVQVDGQSGFLLQEHVEAADERPATRHDDAAVHDVGGELGRRDFQRAPDRIHDLLDRLLYRFAHFTRMHAHDLRNARDQVAPLHSISRSSPTGAAEPIWILICSA